MGSIGGYTFEIALALTGVVLGILGPVYLKGWYRRAAAALGGLLVLAALLSVALNTGSKPRRGSADATLSSTGRRQAAPSGRPEGSLAPTTALFQLPASPPTDTPRPAPIVTKQPSATPTSTPQPTPTPVQPRRRLEYREREERVHALYIADLVTEQEAAIYSEKSPIPVYSAAWSPVGKEILLSLRWYTSPDEHGAKLSIYEVATGSVEDIFILDMVEPEHKMGNALWLPDGDRIVLYLQQGSEGGVHILNADGTGLQRLENTEAGEWPRYLSVDGEWVIAIMEDGSLSALEVLGNRRMPLGVLGQIELYDERYEPWRIIDRARCKGIKESWWKCK